MSADKPPIPEAVRAWLRRHGKYLGETYGAKGGMTTAERLTPAQRSRNASKAGKAASANLTEEQRKARARTAAQAMWAKKRAAAKAKKKGG